MNDPLEPASFDLVHARAVHPRQQEEVLARLVVATRPGGREVIQDVDFGSPAAAMAARYFIPVHISTDQEAPWPLPPLSHSQHSRTARRP